MNITFSVDADNVVTVFNNGESFVIQPYYPDGSEFGSAKEANAWGAAFVAHYLDPSKPEAPSAP